MSKTEIWGILLAVAGLAVPLALYLIDKAGKNTPVITVVLLCLIAALRIGAAFMIPWIWAPPSAGLRVWRASLTFACVVFVVFRFGIWVWPPPSLSTGQEKQAPPKPVEKPPTLAELFTKDFSTILKVTDDSLGIKWNDGTILHIKRQVYLDFPAKTKFAGFYVPSSDPLASGKDFQACVRLAEAVQQALDEIPKKVAISGGYRGEMNSIQDLTFSGRVIIYHEAFLPITQKATIINAYPAKHFDVQFTGPDYLADQIIAWTHQHDPKDPH